MATANLLDMTDRKSADKQKALDSALAQIERQFGKGSIMKLGGDNPIKDIESTSTGSLGLDIALGIGGLPKGRIIEIYGPESSGKTTLTLHCVAEEQKKGGVCAFVDAEHALDPQYARKLGVDLDELLISQPDTGGAGARDHRHAGAVRRPSAWWWWTRSPPLTPKSELEGDMGDSSVGVHARLMSQAMRKLTGSIARSKLHGHLHQPDPHEDRRHVRFARDHHGRQRPEILFLSSPASTSAASARSKDRDEVVGNATRVKVVKNKVAPPFQAGRVRYHVRRRHLQGPASFWTSA